MRNFLFNLAKRFLPSLITILEKGTKVYRARIKENDQEFEHRDLTSPPNEIAGNNRMSPAGISFFYGSLDWITSLYEVRPYVGDEVIIGEFEVIKNLFVLDLTLKIDARKSIFNPEYCFHYEEYYKPFLRYFTNEISKPIRQSICDLEYVPTQVFTEFIRFFNFRHYYETGDDNHLYIHGIMYKSSVNADGKNLVLFRGQDISTDDRNDPGDSLLIYNGNELYKIKNIILWTDKI